MKKKLFIGLPVYGGVDIHFFDAFKNFMDARATENFPCQIGACYGDSLVSRARNSITMEFLRSDCTHLLMIDSDLVFSLEQIKRLLTHEVNIVGGFYPKKNQGKPEMVFNCLPDTPAPDDSGLLEVKYMGSGFLMVSRKVIEAMISELGDELIFKLDGQEKFAFDFWPVGVYRFKDGTRRYLSEDWYFCQRAIDLGFKIYGDRNILLKHSGNAVYPLESQLEEIYDLPARQRMNLAGGAKQPTSPPAASPALT